VTGVEVINGSIPGKNRTLRKVGAEAVREKWGGGQLGSPKTEKLTII